MWEIGYIHFLFKHQFFFFVPNLCIRVYSVPVKLNHLHQRCTFTPSCCPFRLSSSLCLQVAQPPVFTFVYPAFNVFLSYRCRCSCGGRRRVWMFPLVVGPALAVHLSKPIWPQWLHYSCPTPSSRPRGRTRSVCVCVCLCPFSTSERSHERGEKGNKAERLAFWRSTRMSSLGPKQLHLLGCHRNEPDT